MVFSSTGRSLALGIGDNELSVIETVGGKSLLRFAFNGRVKLLAFSQNDRLIAGVASDKTARIIDLESSEEISRMSVEGPASRSHFPEMADTL